MGDKNSDGYCPHRRMRRMRKVYLNEVCFLSLRIRFSVLFSFFESVSPYMSVQHFRQLLTFRSVAELIFLSCLSVLSKGQEMNGGNRQLTLRRWCPVAYYWAFCCCGGSISMGLIFCLRSLFLISRGISSWGGTLSLELEEIVHHCIHLAVLHILPCLTVVAMKRCTSKLVTVLIIIIISLYYKRDLDYGIHDRLLSHLIKNQRTFMPINVNG